MDYETSDGSHFSIREIWSEDDASEPSFYYTNINATVNGEPYVGKSELHADEIDESDIMTSLEPVEASCVYPIMPANFTAAPSFDPEKHYLKAPSFMWNDCRSGTTFVADCVLAEAGVLERLRTAPHPNIVQYHGCVTKNGRITHLCLAKYSENLVDCAERRDLSETERIGVLEDITAAIDHLHFIGLAHNDVTPFNICLDAHRKAVLVDFDSCMPVGQPLKKGFGESTSTSGPVSSMDNDKRHLKDLEDFLYAADDRLGDPKRAAIG